ncbi:MAG: GldG family protein [Verrucomicrobia bacterium]|nr:GldG family protein [Verrucomicrobiota bacterium]
MDGIEKPSFSPRRRFWAAVQVVISVVALGAACFLVNKISANHYVRTHLASEGEEMLSPLTVRLLDSITNRVKVIVFFDSNDPVFSSVEALLREYRLKCPNLEVEYVDYLRNPGRAQLVKDKYKLSFVSAGNNTYFKNLVLFDCNGRTKLVHGKELSDYDVSEVLSGESRRVKRKSFKGEMLFTSALFSVIDLEPQNVYFLEGHREMDYRSEGESGYSKFADILRQMNLELERLSLRGTNRVPEDCNLLVVAGPQDTIAQAELEKITAYLNGGGRAFILINSLFKKSGLEKLLPEFGVRLGYNFVLDEESTFTGQDMLVTNFVAHPIVKPLFNSGVYMVLPQSVSKVKGLSGADTAKVEEIAFTSDSGIAVTTDSQSGGYENPFQDFRGPIPVMAAVEKGGVQGVSNSRDLARLVVIGDSLCMRNQAIDSVANRDFVALAVNWLLERGRMMGGIGPRPVKEYRLTMTQSQIAAVRWLLLIGGPGIILGFGFVVWVRRQY